jgi:hypothetical protein
VRGLLASKLDGGLLEVESSQFVTVFRATLVLFLIFFSHLFDYAFGDQIVNHSHVNPHRSRTASDLMKASGIKSNSQVSPSTESAIWKPVCRSIRGC